jgi:hypothetical protein
MALTLEDAYKGALGQGFAESWLVEISNTGGSGTAAYIRIGTEEVGSGASAYHPLIQNRMSIRESIDLEKGTAKTGNISITCHDGTLANHSQKLSKEILNQGTRYYLNHTVTVKSKVGSIGSSDYLTIFTGRLKDVKLNSNHQVVLTIASATPIDFIKIPQYQSGSGNYFPIFYGEGTPIDSKVGTPGTGSSNTQFIQYSPAKVFPVEVDSLNNGRYNCLAHKAVTDGKLHYPLKDSFSSTGFPLFVPLDDIQNTSTNDYEGTTDSNRNVLFTALDLERAYLLRPVQDISATATKTILGDPPTIDPSPNNTANFYDNDDTTFGTWKVTMDVLFAPPSSSVTDTETFTYSINDIEKEEHEIQECKLYIKWGVSDYNETPSTTLNANLKVKSTYGGLSNTITINTESGNRTPAYESAIDLLSTGTFSSANGQIPDSLDIIFEAFGSVEADDTESPGTLQFNVYDFYLEITTKIVDDEGLATSNAVTSIKKLYTGSDGLTKSFDSGTVTNIVDMHRDLLSRFTGRGGSGETPDINTSNYSALSTARNSWTVQYWTSKEEEVMKLLEKAQFEGGFVFRFRTSNEKPQYIYIPNGTPTADHTIGLEDIRTYDLSMTPIDKLITKRVIKYQRSPINNNHILEQTSEDTTNSIRANYNILSNENIETNTLDMLVGGIGAEDTGTGNRNDGFANYYKQINGEPKFLCNIEIINSETSNASNYFYGMEVGDFCTFESSVINNLPVFSGLSTSTVFIVTGITRSPGSLKVTLREI